MFHFYDFLVNKDFKNICVYGTSNCNLIKQYTLQPKCNISTPTKTFENVVYISQNLNCLDDNTCKDDTNMNYLRNLNLTKDKQDKTAFIENLTCFLFSFIGFSVFD